MFSNAALLMATNNAVGGGIIKCRILCSIMES